MSTVQRQSQSKVLELIDGFDEKAWKEKLRPEQQREGWMDRVNGNCGNQVRADWTNKKWSLLGRLTTNHPPEKIDNTQQRQSYCGHLKWMAEWGYRKELGSAMLRERKDSMNHKSICSICMWFMDNRTNFSSREIVCCLRNHRSYALQFKYYTSPFNILSSQHPTVQAYVFIRIACAGWSKRQTPSPLI